MRLYRIDCHLILLLRRAPFLLPPLPFAIVASLPFISRSLAAPAIGRLSRLIVLLSR